MSRVSVSLVSVTGRRCWCSYVWWEFCSITWSDSVSSGNNYRFISRTGWCVMLVAPAVEEYLQRHVQAAAVRVKYALFLRAIFCQTINCDLLQFSPLHMFTYSLSHAVTFSRLSQSTTASCVSFPAGLRRFTLHQLHHIWIVFVFALLFSIHTLGFLSPRLSPSHISASLFVFLSISFFASFLPFSTSHRLTLSSPSCLSVSPPLGISGIFRFAFSGFLSPSFSESPSHSFSSPFLSVCHSVLFYPVSHLVTTLAPRNSTAFPPSLAPSVPFLPPFLPRTYVLTYVSK